MTAPFTPFASPTWSIGGLVLNTDDAAGVRWVVGVPAGGAGQATTGWWDLPTQRTFDTPMPRDHGDYRSAAYKSGRPITITGWVEAPNKGLRENARDALVGLPFGTGTLTLTVTDDYSTRWAACELVDLKTSAPNVTGFDFQLSLNAPDPRKYGSTPSGGTATVPASTGGLDYTGGGAGGLDYTGGGGGGLNYGTQTSAGTLTVVNVGTTDTWPVFTLVGPLVNPIITNTTTGQQIAYNGTILAGQTVVITTNPLMRSVVLNSTTDVRANLATAQFAAIPPKSQVIYVLSAAPTDTGVLTAQAYPAWW